MYIATIMFLALAQDPAPAIAPTTCVTHDEAEGTTTIAISHEDGLRAIDWQTLQVVANGHDATRSFRVALRSPDMAVSINPQMTSLSITGATVLVGPAIGVGVCPVVGPCAPVEVLLRDASGYPDAQYTDQQPLLPVWDNGGGVNWEMSGVPFTPAHSLTISKLQGVVNDFLDSGMAGDWGNFSWSINVFVADSTFPTAMDAFDANARHGNLVDDLPLDESHVDFNGDYYVTLVPGAPILLAAGTEYWISVKALQNGGVGSSPSFRHTVFGNNPTDFGMANTIAQSVPYTNLGITPGALALDIYGY
jgi:hypothetical protein